MLVLGVDMVPQTLPVGTYFQAELDTHKQNCFLGIPKSGSNLLGKKIFAQKSSYFNLSTIPKSRAPL